MRMKMRMRKAFFFLFCSALVYMKLRYIECCVCCVIVNRVFIY
jgi:hypothetical protein